MNNFLKLLLAFGCLVWAVPMQAQHDDIYTVCVSAENPADDVESLVRKGLTGLLISLSQDEQVAQQDVIAAELTQAPKYLQGYRYRDACSPEHVGRSIELYFAAQPLEHLVASLHTSTQTAEEDIFAQFFTTEHGPADVASFPREYLLVVESVYDDTQYQQLTAKLEQVPEIDSIQLQQVSTHEVIYQVVTAHEKQALIQALARDLPVIPLSGALSADELRILYVS